MLTLAQRLQKVKTSSQLEQQLRLATLFTQRMKNALCSAELSSGQRMSLNNEYQLAKSIEACLKTHYFELHEALSHDKPLLPVCDMQTPNNKSLRKGQRVTVEWQGKTQPLTGTVIETSIALSDEAFERVIVEMDNGFECVYPGFHPNCVKVIQQGVTV